MNQEQNGTIAAVATPAGEGGIAVIRISGAEAKRLAESVMPGAKQLKDRSVRLCTVETESVQDEVLAIYFKAPRSFTGEDIVEIQCHGNYFIAEKIVEALIKNGCRAAEPGEFTRRAFLNGKIDLTKAEGILDLIRAKSEAAAAAAYAQVKGSVFQTVSALQQELVRLIAEASAAVDYPEEDITEPAKEALLSGIKPLKAALTELKDSYGSGAMVREGVSAVIAGKPNVGKSRLLNCLLGSDRAIVSDEAGTTRDTIEESFLYKGIRFKLTDTAGFRTAATKTEQLGIERSGQALLSADLILAVSEADGGIDAELPKNKPVLFVKNKSDLLEKAPVHNGADTVYVSALTGENIGALKERMFEMTVGKISASGAGINNLRQLNAVTGALNALERAETESYGLSLDCMLSDLNGAYRALGSVTGLIASDEIVREIFSKFCVGK